MVTPDGVLVDSVGSYVMDGATAGFVAIGTEWSFANGRGAQIEETILRKD